MTARFITSRVDPRKLSMLDHQLARQSAGERRRIHGPLLAPSRATARRLDRWTGRVSITLAIATVAFFAVQLARLA